MKKLLAILLSMLMLCTYIPFVAVSVADEHYIELVANALQYFHKDTVIARLTGDGVAEDLLAPDWSRKKTMVINDIDKYLFNHNMWQGKLFNTWQPIKDVLKYIYNHIIKSGVLIAEMMH